ncbi:glutathione-S-transferase [Zalerion maritima]|uniref:Glutathione-S-transferase n=1 Tax=Zalerion maritima TaxID=339359 RepID=A0AAD5RQC1_9PEZI|nr:glutathione-S-transferase [Zalerion maritima]
MSSTTGKITDWVDPKSSTGEFKRQVSSFRSFISRGPGSKFPPEAGRYHIFVSYACPWAHRTLITRKLKGLEDVISFSVVHWNLGEGGWRFPTSEDIAQAGQDGLGEGMNAEGIVKGAPLEGMEDYTHLRQVYFSADTDYSGRYTVPVLWDKKEKTIVSNESSEIIRMLYTEFDDLLDPKYKSPQVDLFPGSLQSQIEETNSWTYDNINNGVYKSGFATTQSAYNKAVTALFEHLDKAEKHLSTVSSEGPFYNGKSITEADIRLYVTLIRFDPVYVQHFKCNIRDIRSGYPRLHKWMRNLYWNVPAFGQTTDITHIKNHYTRSHKQVNPLGITPLGPLPNILPLDEEVRAVKT